MKQKLIFPSLIVLAVITAAFFGFKSQKLQNQLTTIHDEHTKIEAQLSEYEALFRMDSVLFNGEYQTAIQSYNQSLANHNENKMEIPLRIALAEKLLEVEASSKNTTPKKEETVDSTQLKPVQAVFELDKYDSLNFALEKAKVQLAKMRRQLKQKSYGEYLKFKSKKGNQMHYVGQVKNGKANGFGIALLNSGSRYEGQWKDNERHGEGTYYWPDGEYYVGEYVNDKRNGFGTYYWPNGEKYAGQWRNDKRSGTGEFFGTDGDVVTGGIWSEDKLVEASKKRKK